MKEKKLILILSLFSLFFFAISKLLGASFLVSLFLGASVFILYYFSKFKRKKIGIIAGIITLLADIILFILVLVPVQGYDLKVEEFYKNRDNYMKIFPKDPKEKLRAMYIKIENKGKTRKIIVLSNYKKGTKIKLIQGDKIYFIGMKTNKSFAVIYLWDGTILRLTPLTRIKLDKVTKNLKDLTNNKTLISVENGNLWFKVIKLIKGGDNMQIKTGKGQTLIIRGTAGLISKDTKTDTTYVVDYKHFVEVKVGNKSKILNEKQGAEIKNNEIEIVDNIEEILKQIGLDKELIKEFDLLDSKELENINKEIKNFIKENINLNKLEEIKLKLFSIGDKSYSNILEKIETYKYLLGENNQITDLIKNNPNIAFIAGNLGDYKAKTAYLYNQIKNNIKNSDIYKTYIINLGVEKKVSNIGKFAKDYINNISQQAKELGKELQNTLNELNSSY